MAEMAARAVLAGVANATPKSGEGDIEMIRMLKSTKDSDVKARTQAVNQMKALVVTAPAVLRETLDGLTSTALAGALQELPPGVAWRIPQRRPSTPFGPLPAATFNSIRRSAFYRPSWNNLTRRAAPALVSIFGVGPDTAAALLISAGSNPQDIHSEAAFAALCGVNPIPASSGKTNRHRLNRGGDRQANAALYRVVLVRLSHDLRTREYMHRGTGEGMSKPEVIRCLKRYVVREVYSVLKVSSGNAQYRALTSIGASVAKRCSLSGVGFLIKNHCPRFRGAPSHAFRYTPQCSAFGGFGLRDQNGCLGLSYPEPTPTRNGK